MNSTILERTAGGAGRLWHALASSAALLCSLALVPGLAGAADDDVLPPEEAFRYEVSATAEAVTVQWDIAPGYYMYRERMKYTSASDGVVLGEASFSSGKVKNDEFFGKVEVYRKQARVVLPLRSTGNADTLELKIRSQGCADVGLCYPPTTWTASVALPAKSRPAAAEPAPTAAADPLSQALNLGGANGGPAGLSITGDDFLPPEQAFAFHTEIVDAFTIRAVWTIAEGYYLYRDKFAFAADDPAVQLQPAQLPRGEEKFDEHFGQVEVFHDRAEAIIPVGRERRDDLEFTLTARFQGCAEQGLCYPPTDAASLILLPAAGGDSGATSVFASADLGGGGADGLPVSEQNVLASTIIEGNLLYVIGVFFLGGVLLAFTPCVFPMFPILSGIIVGQQRNGDDDSTRRAFVMSSIYVLAMALTYTAAGVVTAMLGANLQAAFQHPAVLVSFSVLFVVLALSMFGVYELQMPTAIQSRLTALSNRQQGGSTVGVAIMGALSALIVGPCVAAPLAAALIVIGQGGDPVRGGIALFALGLGMGAPLIAYGTSAGKLLPRAGAWMERVKMFFGITLLAVAVWMLSRILPESITMVLWAVLGIGGGMALAAVPPFAGANAAGTPASMRVAGAAMAGYGAVLAATLLFLGGTDPLAPLQRHDEAQELEFTRIASVAELESQVARAGAAGRMVMVDFYADWCTSCKEMEKHTFTDARVRDALDDAVLLQADVTANNRDDQALLDYFGIYGPPTIAFFSPAGEELRNARVVGFMPAERFEAHLTAVVAATASRAASGGQQPASTTAAAVNLD